MSHFFQIFPAMTLALVFTRYFYPGDFSPVLWLDLFAGFSVVMMAYRFFDLLIGHIASAFGRLFRKSSSSESNP